MHRTWRSKELCVNQRGTRRRQKLASMLGLMLYIAGVDIAEISMMGRVGGGDGGGGGG